MTTHNHCPECGATGSLYRKADARWNFSLQVWELGDLEEETECTACDWSGEVSETEYTPAPNN